MELNQDQSVMSRPRDLRAKVPYSPRFRGVQQNKRSVDKKKTYCRLLELNQQKPLTAYAPEGANHKVALSKFLPLYQL